MELIQAVKKLCNDGRNLPWDRVTGLGRKWLDLFLRWHPQLSERSFRIYEVNRINADDEPRLRQFYTNWKGLVTRLQPRPDHVWNTDETGALAVKPPQLLPGSLYSSVQQNTTLPVPWFPVQQCATAQNFIFISLPSWTVCRHGPGDQQAP